ncbi:MAG TPA: alpha/beta hydrolase [Flavobacterium sp.]|jgi:pimeloyl-ACP methyl ester carboxylesterase
MESNYSAKANLQNSSDYIETAPNVLLHVKDYGHGKPVILIHGWPLSSDMWEHQIQVLVDNNFRVLAYDRRGFGKSSHPWDGYDYDTLADDLRAIIDEKGLSEVTLVGFSMGGGEVARYFSRHSGHGITKAVFISSVTPFMLKTDDNEDGMPKEDFDKMEFQIRKDRFDFLKTFGKEFYGVGLISKPVSSAHLENDFHIAAGASPRATLECLHAFSRTDFRADLHVINVPTLMIHGDEDKTVPIESSSEKAANLIPNCRFIMYDGAPHGLFYTEKERLNRDLIEFLNEIW